MSTDSPNGASADQDIETIQRLATHHYFQALVNAEVDRRTEEQLGRWWRRVAATIGIIVAITGAFGIKAAYDLNSLRDDAEAQMRVQRDGFEEQNKQYRARLDDVETLAGHTKTTIEDAKTTVEAVRTQQNTSNQQLFELMNTTQERMHKIAGDFGHLAGSFTSKEEELGRQASAISNRLSEADARLASTTGLLDQLKAEAARRDEQYTKISQDVARDVDGRITGLKTDVRNLHERVFFRGSFVVREKTINVISPDGTGEQLEISTERFSKTALVKMAITCGDKIVYGPKNMPAGSTVTFRSNGYRFELSLRYIREIPLEADDAQIDLTWTKELPGDSARR